MEFSHADLNLTMSENIMAKQVFSKLGFPECFIFLRKSYNLKFEGKV